MMEQPILPIDLPEAVPVDAASRTRPDQARVRRAVGNQAIYMARYLDSLVSDDHRARSLAGPGETRPGGVLCPDQGHPHASRPPPDRSPDSLGVVGLGDRAGS